MAPWPANAGGRKEKPREPAAGAEPCLLAAGFIYRLLWWLHDPQSPQFIFVISGAFPGVGRGVRRTYDVTIFVSHWLHFLNVCWGGEAGEGGIRWGAYGRVLEAKFYCRVEVSCRRSSPPLRKSEMFDDDKP